MRGAQRREQARLARTVSRVAGTAEGFLELRDPGPLGVGLVLFDRDQDLRQDLALAGPRKGERLLGGGERARQQEDSHHRQALHCGRRPTLKW
jgi:hypothetical protein